MERISIIVPCYNEQEVLPIFYNEVIEVFSMMDADYELVFVNDGSKDDTLNIIKEKANNDCCIRYISFSRNFGKEAAMYAGFCNASGDYVVVMDADMQDPPALLPEMVKILKSGEYDSVATRRANREGEPLIRSFFARRFYRIINKLSDVDIADGARDFRIMRRSMVDAFISMGEYNRFSKGIFGWIGFKTYWLNISSWAGVLMTIMSFVSIIFIVARKIVFDDPVAGWASTICIIVFIGGIQLLSLGIMGQYVAKAYMEVKGRPHYIVAETNIKNTKLIN